MAWLVDAGDIYAHGLVDGHGHGWWDYLQYPPSLFRPKNRQALVRLQLLSAVQHMHERLPFLLWGRMGQDGEMSAGMTDLEKGHFFSQKGISSARQIFILRIIMFLIFFLSLIQRVRNFLDQGSLVEGNDLAQVSKVLKAPR